MWGAHFNFLDN